MKKQLKTVHRRINSFMAERAFEIHCGACQSHEWTIRCKVEFGVSDPVDDILDHIDWERERLIF